MELSDLRQRIPEQVFPALIAAASIDPEVVLEQLRQRGLGVTSVDDLRRLDLELLDPVATDLIRRSRRVSAVSGVGSGMAGWIAVAPDVAQQLVTLLRLAQRMSLLYGVDFRTPTGEVELWKALARATGVKVDRQGKPTSMLHDVRGSVRVGDVSSNPLVRTLALAVVRRLVLRLSAPLGRLVPIVGGGISGWTNYVEIGRAGHRMMAYYRARRSMIDDESAEIIEVDVVR